MVAAEQLITANLDIWSSAIKTKSAAGRGKSNKIELYGIKKLRELILELAVRGLLVPQDPNDEPASDLLKKIAAERARLVKDGKIKKPKALSAIEDGEKPYELPEGWEWARFGSVYWLEYGDNLPKAKRSGTGEYPVYGSNGVVGTHNDFCVESLCIVVGRKGSAGALNLCLDEHCWVTDVAYSLVPPTCMLIEFVFRQLHTLNLDSLGKGIKPGLSRNEAYVLTVALPPVEEQARIVAKVDELMALCDQLEQQQETSITAHQSLVQTLLDALTTAGERDGFTAAWARIATHFDTLFTTEWSIEQLKQTILQLAVMGKLVPQDQQEIALSAVKLREQVKRERQSALMPKTSGKYEVSIFDSSKKKALLPDHWETEPLANMALAIIDCPHSTPKWSESGEICVRTNQFRPGFLDLSNTRYVSSDTYQKRVERLVPEDGDILYSREGGILGVACIIPPGVKLCLGQRMMLIRPPSFISSKYLEMVLNSPFINGIARENTTGGAAPRVNLTAVKAYPIPVPPTEHQHRIVATANELMALCDTLKTRLNTAQTTQLHLADAMCEQAAG